MDSIAFFVNAFISLLNSRVIKSTKFKKLKFLK